MRFFQSVQIIFISLLSLSTFKGHSQEKGLEYLFRYNCHRNPTADHLMCVEQLSADRVIVAGNLGLALLNPYKLPVNGTQESIQQYTEFNIRNIYVKDNYIYANINSTNSKVIPGFDIFKVENDKIEQVKSISESNMFFDKMCLDGEYLYVTAHSHGLRIYDITKRETPALIGKIVDGFADAYDVFVSGDSAYVADGHGGLKVVDVSDKSNPKIVFSENEADIIGTSQAITADKNNVYLIAGSEGVLVYNKNNFNAKSIIPTGAFAEDCTWAGDLLVVTCYTKVLLYEITAAGLPQLVAHERSSRREQNGTMRTLTGAGCMNDTILMCANWNYLDFYNIKDATKSTTPDINATADRLRFQINGGIQNIALSNNGYGNLKIEGISSKNKEFTTDFSGVANLAHNDTLWVEITYTASDSEASDILLVESNDIDENPLPIQVYGKTKYMDPGEKAVDFTYDYITKNNETGAYSTSSLTLSDFEGKVVWFAVFGSSCPACPPVISDMQTRIIDEFKDNPNVVTFLYNGKEGEKISRLYEYFDWYYLNTGIVYDQDAETFLAHYDQINTGLPWGKSYIIDQNGIIHKAMFGYNPENIISSIYALLENAETSTENMIDNTDQFKLTAYPNPSLGTFWLQYTLQKQEDIQISVFDTAGNKVKSIRQQNQKPGNHIIPIAGLKNGIYGVKISGGLGQSQVIKLVKTK